jgi:hypothetical protein
MPAIARFFFARYHSRAPAQSFRMIPFVKQSAHTQHIAYMGALHTRRIRRAGVIADETDS